MKEKEPRRSQTDKTKSLSTETHRAQLETSYMIKGLLIAVAPFLVTYILEIIAYFADFAIVTALNTYLGFKIDFDEDSYIGGTMPTNTAITNLIYALLCLIIFGWWYLMVCEKNRLSTATANTAKKAGSAKNEKKPENNTGNTFLKTIALLVAGGIAFQLFVDSIIALIKRVAPKLFTSYDEMIGNMTERTFLLMLTVILLGPIAEEIIFRGLTLHFAKKVLSIKPAVLFTALLFGLYHGSIIQGIYAFVAGIVFCQITIKFKSILPAVFLHIMVNASVYMIPQDLFSAVIPTVLTFVMSGAILYLVFLKLIKRPAKNAPY